MAVLQASKCITVGDNSCSQYTCYTKLTVMVAHLGYFFNILNIKWSWFYFYSTSFKTNISFFIQLVYKCQSKITMWLSQLKCLNQQWRQKQKILSTFPAKSSTYIVDALFTKDIPVCYSNCLNLARDLEHFKGTLHWNAFILVQLCGVYCWCFL